MRQSRPAAVWCHCGEIIVLMRPKQMSVGCRARCYDARELALHQLLSDPRIAKKLVKRELTRIVTPGTLSDAHLLRSHENNYLAAVARSGQRSGVAHVDISTGEFRVTEVDPHEVAGTLEHLGAREVLFPADLPLLTGENPAARFLRTELEDWIFSFD